MRTLALLAALAATPAVAQDAVVLEFSGAGETIPVTPADLAQVQFAEDGDRAVVLLDMGEDVAEAFAGITEAAEGEDLAVILCGAELFRQVSQGRIEGGKLLLPMPNATFGNQTAAVLSGDAGCETIRADE